VSTDNNTNNIDNDGSLTKTKDKTPPPAPTLGEAIKEAAVANGQGQEETTKENSTGIALTLDGESDAKLEITVEDETVKGTEAEDKIVVDSLNDASETKEAMVATVTTIPADEEVEVEIETEIEVPVKDSSKDVEADLKVKVKSPNAIKEVPLTDADESMTKE
jgi:hypothetical protein